jgi:hypothetical protein
MSDEARWEWRGDPPSTDDVRASLESLTPVFGLPVIRYVDYVLPMTNREKQDDGTYVPVTKLYMQVAGRVKMLADCVRLWGWKAIESERIISPPGEVYILQIGVEITGRIPYLSEGKWGVGTDQDEDLYGIRYGIAKSTGNIEKMETGARGRALGAWGLGILPGSGIASLDEMQTWRDEPVYGEGRPATKREETVELDRAVLEESIVLRVEQLRQINSVGGSEVTIEKAQEGLIGYIKKNLGKGVAVIDGQMDFSALGVGQLKLIDQRLDGWIREAKEKATS